MRTLAPTPREIIAASIWNSRGQPFTPIQTFEAMTRVVFRASFNEHLPMRCQVQSAALVGNAAGASLLAPAATNRENE